MSALDDIRSQGDQGSTGGREKEKRHQIMFTKHCETEVEKTKIFVSLASSRGGKVRIRHVFKTDHQIQIKPKVEKAEEVNLDGIVADLDAWYKHNVKFMPGYKNMLARKMDFMALNKRERLYAFHPENQQIQQHNKMWANYDRRETAVQKAEELEEENHEIHLAYITKWEEYREKKIQLTAIFIKVLKKKNYLRRWLRLQKAGQIFKQVVDNCFIRREFNRIKCMRYFVRIKWLSTYKFTFQKRHGFEMDTRKRNEIRRCLNFAAAVRFQAIEEEQKRAFKKFLINCILARQASHRFGVFFTNLVRIQDRRRELLQWRELKFERLFRYLREQAEFLMSVYAKKKSGKKAVKMVKNLKKYFDPKRIEDLRMVRQQMEILGDRNMLDCQSLYRSVDIRAVVLTSLILGKSGKKEEVAPTIETL
jgi:hypothetical protein